MWPQSDTYRNYSVFKLANMQFCEGATYICPKKAHFSNIKYIRNLWFMKCCTAFTLINNIVCFFIFLERVSNALITLRNWTPTTKTKGKQKTQLASFLRKGAYLLFQSPTPRCLNSREFLNSRDKLSSVCPQHRTLSTKNLERRTPSPWSQLPVVIHRYSKLSLRAFAVLHSIRAKARTSVTLVHMERSRLAFFDKTAHCGTKQGFVALLSS